MHEGEEGFASLSKGVFVIPFDPTSSSRAGPSRQRRSLRKVYEATYGAYQAAHNVFEADKTAEQLDDIHLWLERCSSASVLKFQFPAHRLPVAILQDAGLALDEHLCTEIPGSCTVHGRDLTDLASATRGAAVGWMGEALLAGKKFGRTPLDEVEQWYKTAKRREGHGELLLLHIEQAQLLPAATMAELLYILSLHTELPVRVLLSVSSISTFMASWTHIDPFAIAVSVFSGGRNRRKHSMIRSLLKSPEVTGAPLRLSNDFVDDLAQGETLGAFTGSGSLKALKWNLLHHEFNSPLSRMADHENGASIIQSLLDASQDHPEIPGADFLQTHHTEDAKSALDPSPRISILQALSAAQPYLDKVQEPFLPTDAVVKAKDAAKRRAVTGPESPATPGRKRRKRIETPPPSPPAPLTAATEACLPLKDRKGELKEMELLFNLWKSAGRNVNLWDWLEAFRIMAEEGYHPKPSAVAVDGGARLGQLEDYGAGPEREDVEGGKDREEVDEETAARLHATFVRFCEEARMLGLVRARGKGTGRRGDEVAKGIGMV